jgi:nitrogen fixation protein FixH
MGPKGRAIVIVVLTIPLFAAIIAVAVLLAVVTDTPLSVLVVVAVLAAGYAFNAVWYTARARRRGTFEALREHSKRVGSARRAEADALSRLLEWGASHEKSNKGGP